MTVHWKELRDWMGIVGGYLSPAFPADATEALIRLERPLLEFGPDAFTEASAQLVASAKRYGPVPDLQTVQDTLRQYLRDVRPFRQALPAPREPEPEPPDEAAIARIEALVVGMKRDAAVRAAALVEARVPLADVTLSGNALLVARERSGVVTRRGNTNREPAHG